MTSPALGLTEQYIKVVIASVQNPADYRTTLIYSGAHTSLSGEMMRSPKRREKSDEGVSATIGTIMALMVFMFLFGMIQTQYVPVAMKDNEANHMHAVESQFSALKAHVDEMIMRDFTNYTYYSPITMGSEGIPAFAAPTPGFLVFNNTKESINVTYSLTTDNGGSEQTQKIYGNVSGYLSLYVPNRYYTQEGYVYSCGAVILYQPSGSVMKANPNFSIINKSGDIMGDMRLVRLIGTPKAQSGTSTVSVHTSLIYTYKDHYGISNESQFVRSKLWINLTTAYPEAWEEWFSSSLTKSGLHNGTDFVISKSLSNSDVYPKIYKVSIEIRNVKMFSLERSLVEMDIGES